MKIPLTVLPHCALKHRATVLLAAFTLGACSSPARSDQQSAGLNVPRVRSATGSTPGAADTVPAQPGDASSYEGVDSRGIPHYSAAILSHEDAFLLKRAYGVADPTRLYVSDSTEEGVLKYDTQRKRCPTCYVNSYRIGYVSVRRARETWEEAERRVRTTSPIAFTGGRYPASTSTADLERDVRPLAEAMLRSARSATHTLTSNHSYGRALDIVVDDWNRGNPRTRRDWIAFRRWVNRYRTPTYESFRVLGRIDRTWDWPLVELPSSAIGSDTIEQAIARARACLAPGATLACNFPPHLPEYLNHALVR